MSSLGGVAPGKLRETGDDESGGIPSGRPPPQGMSFCLPMSCNEFPVLSRTSGPRTALSPLDLWAQITLTCLAPTNGWAGSVEHEVGIYGYSAMPTFLKRSRSSLEKRPQCIEAFPSGGLISPYSTVRHSRRSASRVRPIQTTLVPDLRNPSPRKP